MCGGVGFAAASFLALCGRSKEDIRGNGLGGWLCVCVLGRMLALFQLGASRARRVLVAGVVCRDGWLADLSVCDLYGYVWINKIRTQSTKYIFCL